MRLSLVTAPVLEPLSLTEAKAHLRVDHTADDAWITSSIVTVRRHWEAATERAFITQTWDLRLDEFPYDELVIPKAPLQSVTSIAYLDGAGATQTMAVAGYVIDAPAGPTAQPGRIRPAYGLYWPTPLEQMAAVVIRFVAGYGLTGASVPEDLRSAMLVDLGTLYEHRENEITGTIVSPSRTAERLSSIYNTGRC